MLGPHENTGRMERLLLKLCKGRAIGTAIDGAAGAAEELPLGIVFASDVARAVTAALLLLLEDRSEDAAAARRSLHICCEEAPTWPALVRSAVASLRAAGVEVPEPRFDRTRDTGFISVDFGALDGGAARDALGGWAPERFEAQWRASVEWYVATLRSRFASETTGTAAAEGHRT